MLYIPRHAFPVQAHSLSRAPHSFSQRAVTFGHHTACSPLVCVRKHGASGVTYPTKSWSKDTSGEGTRPRELRGPL